MTLRSGIIAGVLVATMPVVVSAQEPAKKSLAQVIAVGSRIRLTSTAIGGRPQGLVAALDDSIVTLVSDEGGLPLKVPWASITALETSLGRKTNTLKGLGIGAVGGALIGLAFPVNPNDCGSDSENFCSHGEAMAGGALVFGLIGTVVGALIRSDRWAVVTVDATTPQTREGHSASGLCVAVRF